MNGDSSLFGPSSISLCGVCVLRLFAAGLLTAGVLILLVLAHPNEEGYASGYELGSATNSPQKESTPGANQVGGGANHVLTQQDSDCGSSSGLGGMTNDKTGGSSSNSSASNASDSRDSGGGGAGHKSLTATATLTPSNSIITTPNGPIHHPIPTMPPQHMMGPGGPMPLPPHLGGPMGPPMPPMFCPPTGMPPPPQPNGKPWNPAGMVAPPPVRPALYTMTCEAAAFAAAAAAAAGYHVSFGADVWPAVNAPSSHSAGPNGNQSTTGNGAAIQNSANGPTNHNTSNANPSTSQGGGAPGLSPSPPQGSGGPGTSTGLPPGLPPGIAAAINGGHDLFVHIHPGDAISLAVGSEIQHIPGPATIRMVSQSSSPPSAIPMTVPQGHVVQQLLDRQGHLSHIIMSQETPPPQQHPNNMSSASPALASTSSRVSQTGSVPPSKTPATLRSGATTPHKNASQHMGGQPGRMRHNNGNGHSPKSISPTQVNQSMMGQEMMEQNAFGPGGVPPHHRNWATPPNMMHPGGGPGAMLTPNGLIHPMAKRDSGHGMSGLPFYPIMDPAIAAAAGVPPGMPTPFNGMMMPENDIANHYAGQIEEDERERLRDTLNSLQPPTVTRIGARDADIMWLELDTSEAAASGGPFPQLDASEFFYDIFVHEGHQNPKCVMQHRCGSVAAAGNSSVANSGGASPAPSPSTANNGYSLNRLKPATDYLVNIRASLPERDLCGNLSPHTAFRTMPSRPEAPLMPKCLSKQGNAATVGWRAPPPNGAPILAYCVQMCKGKSDPFETVFEGLAEQTRINNLEAGSNYRVRVIARNEYGCSEPSPVLTIFMQTNALQHGKGPAQRPAPPTVMSVSARGVKLSWAPISVDYTSLILEMCDYTRANPNVFNPVANECYASSGTFASVQNLQSNREYRFRLSVTTHNGENLRSEYVSVRTHKERFENAAYYNQQQQPGQGHANQPNQYVNQNNSYIAEKENYRVPTPAQVQRIYDDEETVEIGWKYTGRDHDSVSYVVEASAADEKQPTDWRVCYKGSSTSAAIQDPNLCLFRVQSVNNRRQISSTWSDTLHVKRQSARGVKKQVLKNSTASPAIKPQKEESVKPVLTCTPPKFSNITCHSAKLTWKAISDPSAKKDKLENGTNGATNSLIYEVQRVDKQPVIIYSGNDLEYELKNLRPMEHIQVRLRAVQLDSEGKRQEGDWTPVGFACSLCDVTSPPLNLAIQEPGASSGEDSPVSKPSTSHASKTLKVTLTWNAPVQLNGSSVQEYVVSALRYALDSEGDSHPASEQKLGTCTCPTFTTDKLLPAHRYVFHVTAVNEAGASDKSEPLEYISPASVPDSVDHLSAEALSTSEIRLTWSSPKSNGSNLLQYVITVFKVLVLESGEGIGPKGKSLKEEVEKVNVAADEDTVVIVENLETECTYELTVEAENAVGLGPKEKVRSTTLSPPPEPPVLSVAQVAANSLKLKWVPALPSTSKSNPNSNFYFYLEKENENGTFSPVYEGELRSAKVKGLKERSTHRFRIRAALARNVMVGAWSEAYAFNTIRQPPAGLKVPPNISELSPGLFQVEWQPVKCLAGSTSTADDASQAQSQLIYRLQTSPRTGRDKTGALEPWKTVYEGPTTMCTLNLASAITRQARLLVVQKFNTADSETASEVTEEAISAPSPIALFSGVNEQSPKKRAKANATPGSSSANQRTGAMQRQMSGGLGAVPGGHHKVSMYKRLRRFGSWLKKTVSEKDCALIVLAIFVFLAVSIAIFLNSYYEF
ncbi:fibronectin type III domain-containing protein [Ditylenchus destructor]|nr:fibronectin type III domain-containing protein [Ditylenchus destructor]